jgi:hypothetical protein
VVERLLAKQKVVGSNPIARSDQDRLSLIGWYDRRQAINDLTHGDVAKWKGRGLQNPYSRVRFPPSPLSSHLAKKATAIARDEESGRIFILYIC